MRVLLRLIVGLLVVLLLAIIAVRVRYGGGRTDFPDRTSPPELSSSALEKVVDLDLPPGNIAVSRSGRVFFTFHPEAGPPVQVAELVNG